MELHTPGANGPLDRRGNLRGTRHRRVLVLFYTTHVVSMEGTGVMMNTVASVKTEYVAKKFEQKPSRHRKIESFDEL